MRGCFGWKGANSTNGTTSLLQTVMEQLKKALATVEMQNKTIATLTNTNKQLTESNANLTKLLSSVGGQHLKGNQSLTRSGAPAMPKAENGEEYQQSEEGNKTNPKKVWKYVAPADNRIWQTIQKVLLEAATNEQLYVGWDGNRVCEDGQGQ